MSVYIMKETKSNYVEKREIINILGLYFTYLTIYLGLYALILCYFFFVLVI